MPDNGVRTTNLPLSTERPNTVLAHVDEGGVEVVRRQSIEIFVQYLLGLAGLDDSGVIDLSDRLNQEITNRTAGDAALWNHSVAFSRPQIWDLTGNLGPALTIYVGRAIYARSGSATLNATVGTPSAYSADYVALTVTSTGLCTVYLDLDDVANPIKIANWPAVPPANRPGRIIIITQIRDYLPQSPHPLVNTENLIDDTVFFTRPILADYSVILFPSFFHYQINTGFTQYSPADGSLYWELASNAGANEARYFFSLKEALAGNTPIIRVNSTTRPVLSGGRGLVELAVVNARTVKSNYAVSQCEADNQFLRGKAADGAELFDAPDATTVHDVTNTDLLALGFTRSVGGLSAFYASPLPRDVPAIGRCFIRVYVETDTDNQFGAPRLFIVGGGANLISGGTLLALEKKISARAAIYSLIGGYSLTTQPDQVRVGTFNTAGGPNVRVTGAQAYFGTMTDPAIRRGYYPETFDGAALHGPVLYAIQGRPLPIFVDSMVPDRKAAPLSRAIVSATGSAGLPVVSEHHGSFFPDQSLASMTITVPDEADSTVRYSRSVTQKVAPATVSGSPVALCLGDSVSHRSLISQTKSILQSRTALTPNFIGTMNHQGVMGEGREGWAFRHYVNADPAFPPVPAGQEAAYLARSPDGQGATLRHGFNPFIRLATSAEIAANDLRIRNGYIFDLPFYLTRFGFPVPAYIPLNLGTNDINQQAYPTSVNDITSALPIILQSCLAVSPTVRVGLSLYNTPRTINALRRWREEYVPAIQAMAKAATDVGGGRVDITSLWTVMSPDIGWTTTEQAAVAGNGRARISELLHPAEPNRTLMAEKLAAWVACCAAGV